MEKLTSDLIQKILAPLGIPPGLLRVQDAMIQVQDLGDKPEEYRQLERARHRLVLAGWDAAEVDARTVFIRGQHPDPEFVKFMQAAPGSEAFEGLVDFTVEQKLVNEG